MIFRGRVIKIKRGFMETFINPQNKATIKAMYGPETVTESSTSAVIIIDRAPMSHLAITTEIIVKILTQRLKEA